MKCSVDCKEYLQKERIYPSSVDKLQPKLYEVLNANVYTLIGYVSNPCLHRIVRYASDALLEEQFDRDVSVEDADAVVKCSFEIYRAVPDIKRRVYTRRINTCYDIQVSIPPDDVRRGWRCGYVLHEGHGRYVYQNQITKRTKKICFT